MSVQGTCLALGNEIRAEALHLGFRHGHDYLLVGSYDERNGCLYATVVLGDGVDFPWWDGQLRAMNRPDVDRFEVVAEEGVDIASFREEVDRGFVGDADVNELLGAAATG